MFDGVKKGNVVEKEQKKHVKSSDGGIRRMIFTAVLCRGVHRLELHLVMAKRRVLELRQCKTRDLFRADKAFLML